MPSAFMALFVIWCYFIEIIDEQFFSREMEKYGII